MRDAFMGAEIELVDVITKLADSRDRVERLRKEKGRDRGRGGDVGAYFRVIYPGRRR